MSKNFFDYDDGDFAYTVSDNMAIDSDGDMMMRMGDNMAMDMDSGELHIISSWSDDDDNFGGAIPTAAAFAAAMTTATTICDAPSPEAERGSRTNREPRSYLIIQIGCCTARRMHRPRDRQRQRYVILPRLARSAPEARGAKA